MFRISKERLKAYILLILVIGSFVQVGILWSFKNHGLPFNFLAGFLAKNGHMASTTSAQLKESLFRPYRIIVSKGYDESHWLVERDSEEFSILWADAKNYLKRVLSSKTVTRSLSQEPWDEIAVKKAFIFEFKGNIKSSLIAQHLGTTNVLPEEPSVVYKVAISPWDNVNEGTNTIYILEGDAANARVVKYSLPIEGKDINSKLKYSEIIAKLEKHTNESSIRTYGVVKELNYYKRGGSDKSEKNEKSKDLFPIREDILVVKDSNKYEGFSSIYSNIPYEFEPKDTYQHNELEERAKLILGNDRYSYHLSNDVSGNIVFKNLNSIYKVYKEGILEYKNISELQEFEKGSEVNAFENAVDFIRKANLLPSDTEIFLSSAKYDEKDRYQFTFDYRVAGLPVFVNYKLEGEDKPSPNRTLNNAITIEVNSKRVLNCWWILRNFDVSKEAKKQYNVLFADFMDLALSKNYYADLKNKDFEVKDVSICYEITRSTGSYQKIGPTWVITTGDGRLLPVQMQVKK